MINREFTFNVKTATLENAYPVNFPTVGNLIDIESKKALLSNGVYRSIIAAGTKISEHVLDSIDMQAVLETLCPKLMKDLPKGITSLSQLDIIDSNQLLNQFKKQILPWMNDWMKVLSEMPEVEEEAVQEDNVVESSEEDK